MVFLRILAARGTAEHGNAGLVLVQIHVCDIDVFKYLPLFRIDLAFNDSLAPSSLRHNFSTMLFDSCGDECGWVAGIIAAVAYGSFGVPIRSTKDLDVHPLVLQSYKTVTMFVLSWLVLCLGVAPRWTAWGLVSGILWVAGGTGGVYAIRLAGLAVAVGTWASVMILVNFVWGILVFREPVADLVGTMAAFGLLVLGLIGMSKYSAPQKVDDEREPLQEIDAEQADEDGARSDFVLAEDQEEELAELCGYRMTRRSAGILGAVWNGIMTGSSLIPLHYAKAQGFGGANYMLSLATGALIANVLMWACWFLYELRATRDTSLAVDRMPSIHFQQLWIPGFMAGTLLAIAMFGSILAVTYLGQGIGNSVVQTKILISGLWGIFWFGEIRGQSTIGMWFLSASCAVGGILWLSHERMAAGAGGH